MGSQHQFQNARYPSLIYQYATEFFLHKIDREKFGTAALKVTLFTPLSTWNSPFWGLEVNLTHFSGFIITSLMRFTVRQRYRMNLS